MRDTDEIQQPSDGWQLGGNSAESYERYLVPRMFAPWADELVERAGLEPGNRALDVGCGTGIVARRAARRVGPDGSVIGLDPNEAMLEVAKTISSGEGTVVEWREGDAVDLPFSDETFDAVFCQQVLQFVPNPSTALQKMHRVLVPDGRLAVSVWRPIEFNHSYVVMADALERHIGDEAAAMMRSPFPSWGMNELRDLVSDAGFHDVSITIGIEPMRYPSPEEFVRREAASSPLAGPLGGLERDVREALVRDVEETLREYTDDDGIIFPMEAHVVVARR
ncbi:methyltransferase domain-containing protein [Haladaptatus sp. NG-SE-30]